jgi:FMN-dependent oxidoreductase (nitrilotriacetate monooxygenase family)
VTAAKFHLGWFMNFSPTDWAGEFTPTDDVWSGEFYIDMARSLERAGFDYMLIEDTVMVPDAYGGSYDNSLRLAMMVPKHDPVPLAAIMLAATQRIGIVATMSTSFYHPFMLARLAATVDHIGKGRFGWNIVTSGEHSAAQNFGMDRLTEHDLRYDMAEEYVQLACQLWDSWEPDSVIADRDTATYIRPGSVNSIDFEGKFFRSRGPLNTVRPPGGRPVFLQAGGSPKGRAFAAKWADSIIAIANGPEGMKEYRDDVRAKAAAQGRDPDDIKVLFVVSPVLADTHEEAEAKKERNRHDEMAIERTLALVSSITDIDFAQYPLDEQLPPNMTTNGEQGSLTKFVQEGSGKTLRELARDGLADSVDFVGTPDEVAAQMDEIMEEVGGDGFLITTGANPMNRRYISEITEGLVPALRRRGLTRNGYEHALFRDNLKSY